jgi:hypothetical protein
MRTRLAGIHRPSFSNLSVPLALLGICLLAYGPLIPWLGFYWDDWPMVWFNHAFGPLSFPRAWESVRPVLGWFFIPTMAAFGDHPLLWHLFGLAMRWLSAVSLWWALRQVWPQRGREVTWLALLVAVYPGFQQQSIAVIYSHYFWVLALHWFSIGAMVRGVTNPRSGRAWTMAALLTGAVSVFALEYFLGLELLRPIFLWVALGKAKSRIRRTLGSWVPYLAVFVMFIVWRATTPSVTLYEATLLQDFASQPGVTSGRILHTVAQDIYKATVLAWGQAFHIPETSEFGLRSTLVYVVLVLAATALALVFLARHRPDGVDSDRGKPRWWISACLIGFVSLLVSGWPFWMAELPFELSFPFDRFALGMMFGSCMLLLGILEAIPRPRALRVIALAVLLGFSVGCHFQEANAYRRGWEAQQRFYWNLAWRVPGLEKGTAILANEFPLPYMTDNSLIAPLNWMYAPDYAGGDMPYVILDIGTRLGRSLPGLEDDLPIVQHYRLTTFRGTTSQVLVASFIQPGCVRVLDQYLDDSARAVAPESAAAIHLSQLSLIVTHQESQALLPAHLRGDETTRSWCYYFERADLARQRGDWETVAALGDEAFAGSEKPVQAEERIPFIEGYAHVGEWDRAWELTEAALAHNASIKNILCHAWERIDASTDQSASGRQVTLAALALVCPGP